MNNTRKILAVLLCMALVLAAFCGCGKQENEQPSGGEAQAPAAAPSGEKAAEPGNETPEPEKEPTPEELYETFLNDAYPVTVACNAEGLEKDLSYSISSLASSFAEYLSSEDLQYFIDTVNYAYIDCGADGVPELALSFNFVTSEDYMDFEKLMIVKAFGDELRLVADTFTAYRTQSWVNEYGLISYGGSSSAFSYYQEESFVNAEGERIFFYSGSYNMGMEKAVIPGYELPSDIAQDLRDQELTFAEADGYEMDIINFTEYDEDRWDDEDYYDEYVRNNIFVFSDANGAPVFPEEALLERYRSEGVKIMTYEEIGRMMAEKRSEIGLTEEIEDGSVAEWTLLDPDTTEWLPKG
ncbi:MAG: hypothetical protein IKI65_00540 [Firmicutes bacterium]|nr:hypothetical protein [Bacillota bacterium]